MSLLRIERLTKVYPNATPFRDLSLEIEQGEIVSVIGPSGTGKSTLLRCINQLVEPTSGTVIFDGETITDPACDIARVRRKMGMVFQRFNLFANCTIIENIIAAPIKLLNMPRAEAYARGMSLLQRIGLMDKAHDYPDALSGGQQQRVAIARAIAMKPKILLFDEPTSALDPTMTGEVLGLIRTLAKTGMTMIIVTHEMHFARNVSTRVLYMDEGGIYEDGTPQQIFEHPARERTRQFIHRLRSLPIVVRDPKAFDFLGTLSRIDRFGLENLLPPNTVNGLQLCFEEMLMQLILPHLDAIGHGYPVESMIEYSEEAETVTLSIRYGGDRFNPLEEEQSLPVKLITGIPTSTEWCYAGGNLLTARF